MTNNEFLLLRHAETKITNEIPVSKWTLSEEGFREAENLASLKEFNNLDIIISSCEKKAYLTVEPLALKQSKTIIQFCEFNELKRDLGGFLKSKEEYDQVVEKCMLEPDKSINNWEKASQALNRFSNKLDELDERYENKRILISTHGIVINLYFANILDQLDNVFERWKKTTFCDYGIIKKGVVVKDIAKL